LPFPAKGAWDTWSSYAGRVCDPNGSLAVERRGSNTQTEDRPQAKNGSQASPDRPSSLLVGGKTS